MSVIVNILGWASIAIIFLGLSIHNIRSYRALEKKRKKGKLEVTQGFENNANDVFGIFTNCFKELAITSVIACITSFIAALLPIFI